jgi:polyisoprenoid-binding protein YceI
MKGTILILAMLALFQVSQGQKLITKTGHIEFYSKTPLEEVEAHNRQVVSTLDPASGEMVFMLLIKSFEFKKALMQEHFNENYIESDKYPKASFKGKITNLDKIDFKKDGVYNTEVSGDMTIHNVTKPLTAKGTLEVKGGTVIANSKFLTTPQEWDIEIPSVVADKIAKQIEVTVEATYTPNQ